MATIQYDPKKVRPGANGQTEFLNFCQDLVTVLEGAGLSNLVCIIVSSFVAEFKWQGATLPRLELDKDGVYKVYSAGVRPLAVTKVWDDVLVAFAQAAEPIVWSRILVSQDTRKKIEKLAGVKFGVVTYDRFTAREELVRHIKECGLEIVAVEMEDNRGRGKLTVKGGADSFVRFAAFESQRLTVTMEE